MNSIDRNNKKVEELLRKNNPCCDKVNCDEGDYLELKIPEGAVLCLGCEMTGDDYGKIMVMPKSFVIPT